VSTGLGTVWTECHYDGKWYAAVYWRQLPAWPQQGTAPIRYGHGEFGDTEDEAISKLLRERGLVAP
jgi:hypothetical protein